MAHFCYCQQLLKVKQEGIEADSHTHRDKHAETHTDKDSVHFNYTQHSMEKCTLPKAEGSEVM